MAKIVISLGGSIIVPDKINIGFLKGFKKLIEGYVKKGNMVVVYCGGGSIARKYQESALKITSVSDYDLDFVGIYATWLNAYFVKSIFGEMANSKIISNPNESVDFEYPINVAGGWKPGWSTDYDAVLLAKKIKADKLINITDVDYVYDKDPKKYKGAKPLSKIKWRDFKKLIGKEWKPGLNLPFDPVAIREAEKSKLVVIVVGQDLSNLTNLLENKNFRGTTILP